ncbi:hypothetical protein K8R43_03840 [archaeon]|nr:hypothetical protein [archaeon]
MIDDKLVKWYIDERERGISKEELHEVMQKLGHTLQEIQTIEKVATEQMLDTSMQLAPKVEDLDKTDQPTTPKSEAGTILTFPTMQETTTKRIPKTNTFKLPKKLKPQEYKKVPNRVPKRETLKELLSKEYKSLTRITLGGILLIIFLVIIIFISIFTITEKVDILGTGNIFNKDQIPPKVSVNLSQEGWIGPESIKIECEDTGIDLSTGCNNSSYAYHFTTEEECITDYSLYSPGLLEGGEGFLCAAAKDIEGNTGYSQPIKAKIDVNPPTTTIEQKENWLQQTIQITDTDEESGLNSCYYSLLKENDWKQRECDSEIEVNTSDFQEGENTCLIYAYAIDNVNNEGSVSTALYSVDKTKPTAEITSITPSEQKSGKSQVDGTITIIGTASDTNFKQYTIEGTQNELKTSILQSTQQKIDSNLGNIDTTTLSNGLINFILTVEDLAGNTQTFEYPAIISNDGSGSCTPGTTKVCSTLNGICASSTSTCSPSSSWETCNYASLEDYENIEISCEDNKDNDCDGYTDNEDTDCGGSPPSCTNDCATGETNCSSANNTLFSCGECDNDTCLDWCNPQNCSDCSCTCGNYTMGNESDFTGWCEDGIDNDCDELEDMNDPDCSDCTPDCSLGQTQCNGNINQTCGECDGDSCLDWCEDDCSDDCSCECGGYTMSGNESLVSCSDGIDNDCDGHTDEIDTDCGGGGCLADGETCSQNSDCCNETCDDDDSWCLGCNGGFDLFDGQCESSCGAHWTCDEKNPGETGSSWSCCLSNCWYAFQVGSCSCPTSGTCTEGNGYCLMPQFRCYYNISCTTSGWHYENMCDPSDVCTPLSLITDKGCTDTGCTSGTTKPCTGSEYECKNSTDTQQCKSNDYYCSYGSEGWQWRETPEAEVCDDGYDNDCDGDTDGSDSDCGTPQELCLEDGINAHELYIPTQEYSGEHNAYSVNIGYVSSYRRRASIKWNTASIPDTAIITGVTFKYYCSPIVQNTVGYVYELQNNPDEHIGAHELLYGDCGDGNQYGGGLNIFPLHGSNELELSSDANDNLKAQLVDDWFGIGLMITEDETHYAGIYGVPATQPPPKICINYIA